MKQIYVDIDSLYDTRYTLINKLTNGNRLIIGLEITEYLLRNRDNFGTMSNTIFNYFYKYRNKNLLMESEPTYVFNLVQDTINDLILANANNEEINVVINMYPYVLNEKENEIFLSIFKTMFKNVSIELCYINMLKYPLSKVSGKYNVMIMYNGMEWIESKQKSNEIINNPITNIVLYTPWLLYGNILTKELEANKGEYEKQVQELLKLIVHIKFLPVLVYCFRVDKSNKILEKIENQLKHFSFEYEANWLRNENDNNKIKIE